jgi:uncharacterized protein YcbK (DUF882 family)
MKTMMAAAAALALIAGQSAAATSGVAATTTTAATPASQARTLNYCRAGLKAHAVSDQVRGRVANRCAQLNTLLGSLRQNLPVTIGAGGLIGLGVYEATKSTSP